MVSWWSLIVVGGIGIFAGFLIAALAIASSNWSDDDRDFEFENNSENER